MMREFWFTAEMIFIKPIWGALLYGPNINAAYTTDPLKKSWNRRTNLKGNRTSAFENAVDMHTEMKRKKGAKSAIEGAERRVGNRRNNPLSMDREHRIPFNEICCVHMVWKLSVNKATIYPDECKQSIYVRAYFRNSQTK